MKNVKAIVATVALLASLSVTVSAAPISLNFVTNQSTGSERSTLTYQYGDAQTLTVSGLQAANGNVLSSVNVQRWQNTGIHTTGGTHGISNNIGAPGATNQMMLLDFGQTVSLNAFSISWSPNAGSFASVLAYTGSSELSFNGVTWNNILDPNSGGFSHAGGVNDYKFINVNTPTTVNGGLVSRYWLIGAINPAFGGSTDTFRDAFKLGSVSFEIVDVSEIPLPAAAWLFLTGLAGMGWMKKRKAKKEQLLLTSA